MFTPPYPRLLRSRRARGRARWALLPAGLAAGLLLLGDTAQAAMIEVDTETESGFFDGKCSLREAIRSANTGFGGFGDCVPGDPGGDTIWFSPVAAGPFPRAPRIVLTNGEIAVTSEVIIEGEVALPLAPKAQVSGNDSSRIFSVSAGAILVINDLKMKDGSGFDGGAILNQGVLELHRSSIRDSVAADDGGAIFSSGSLGLHEVIVENNYAQSDGGGVAAMGGTVDVEDTELALNLAEGSGGGLWVDGSSVEINRSAVVENEAGLDGGGIFCGNCGLLAINTTLSTNPADDQGGGLYTSGQSGDLWHLTLTLNEASDGGGLFVAAGIHEVYSTIVAENVGLTGAPDVAGAPKSCGANLFGNVGGGAGWAYTSGGPPCGGSPPFDQVGTPALPITADVEPLADYGGPTRGHEVIEGGHAHETGDISLTLIFEDQRATWRPIGQPDCGAFELVWQPSPGG